MNESERVQYGESKLLIGKGTLLKYAADIEMINNTPGQYTEASHPPWATEEAEVGEDGVRRMVFEWAIRYRVKPQPPQPPAPKPIDILI